MSFEWYAMNEDGSFYPIKDYSDLSKLRDNFRIGLTKIPLLGEVSTVFLNFDHNHSDGPKVKPILFETMIFGGLLGRKNYEYQVRYHTYEEAKLGHKKAVRKVLLSPFTYVTNKVKLWLKK